MKWFRFYSEVVDDPKVQRLHPALFKHWVNLLCLASVNTPRGTLPSLEAIAFKLRLFPADAVKVLESLRSAGLVEGESHDSLAVHEWDARQKPSDSSATRVRRHRERTKQVSSDSQQDDTVTANAAVTLQSRAVEVEEEVEEETPTSDVKTPDKPRFAEDSIPYRLAVLLLTEIRSNDPKFKQPNLQTWALSFDRLIRLDKREPKEIAKLVRWCQQDEFWKANVMSAATFREKYTKLLLRSQFKAEKTAPALPLRAPMAKD